MRSSRPSSTHTRGNVSLNDRDVTHEAAVRILQVCSYFEFALSHHTSLHIGRGPSQWHRSPGALSWARSAQSRLAPVARSTLAVMTAANGRTGIIMAGVLGRLFQHHDRGRRNTPRTRKRAHPRGAGLRTSCTSHGWGPTAEPGPGAVRCTGAQHAQACGRVLPAVSIARKRHLQRRTAQPGCARRAQAKGRRSAGWAWSRLPARPDYSHSKQHKVRSCVGYFRAAWRDGHHRDPAGRRLL